MKVKKVVEEWEIWSEEKEVVKSKEETKKNWFLKGFTSGSMSLKASERILIRKL